MSDLVQFDSFKVQDKYYYCKLVDLFLTTNNLDILLSSLVEV